MKQLFAIFTLMLVVSSLSFAQSSASGSVNVNVARAASIAYTDGARTDIWLVKDATKTTDWFNFTVTGEATATIDVSWSASNGSDPDFSFVETDAEGKDVAGYVNETSPWTATFPGTAPGGADAYVYLRVMYDVTGNTAGAGGTLTVTATIANYSI